MLYKARSHLSQFAEQSEITKVSGVGDAVRELMVDMPGLWRHGAGLGRASGTAAAPRALPTCAPFVQTPQVQEELQATLSQLQAIQSELRGGINILDPG